MATLFGDKSMYRKTEPVIVGGVSTVGTWNRPKWAVKRPDEKYVHRYLVPSHQEGRPDLIAHQLYQSDSLDWVLLVFNNVSNVFGWPKSGAVIEYPDESLVFPAL